MFGNDVTLGVKPKVEEFEGFSGWACCADRYSGAALSITRHNTAAKQRRLVGFIGFLLLADLDTLAICRYKFSQKYVKVRRGVSGKVYHALGLPVNPTLGIAWCCSNKTHGSERRMITGICAIASS